MQYSFPLSRRNFLNHTLEIFPKENFFSDRRVPYSIPADWKALWFSNLDDLQRVNDANDNNTVSNVTVQLGGTAFLHCKVRNLADRTVSDAEVSDFAILLPRYAHLFSVSLITLLFYALFNLFPWKDVKIFLSLSLNPTAITSLVNCIISFSDPFLYWTRKKSIVHHWIQRSR